MRTSINLRFLITSLLVIAILASCKRDRDNETDLQSASDNSQAEEMADDGNNIADNAARLKGGEIIRTSTPTEVFEGLSGCATITEDTTVTPALMTIDFGPVNCLCSDGRYRRGKILVTRTGKYFDAGSIKTIRFDGYYRNDTKLEGTRTVTNMGLNAQSQMYWNINAQNMVITRPDGRTHSWNSSRVRTMVAGASTTTVWRDDAYEITGTATGVNIRGEDYNAEITTPLHRSLSCRWIDSGIIKLTPEGRAERTIDFGDGSCDRLVTVLVRGRSRTIEMN